MAEFMPFALGWKLYDLDVNSTKVVMRLIREKSVFVIPGDCFGKDHFLHISFGLPADYLRSALYRIGELFDKVGG